MLYSRKPSRKRDKEKYFFREREQLFKNIMDFSSSSWMCRNARDGWWRCDVEQHPEISHRMAWWTRAFFEVCENTLAYFDTYQMKNMMVMLLCVTGIIAVRHGTKVLHWKDCVKVFRFENSGINHLCLIPLWENWRCSGMIITQSWEDCVFVMDIS